jgi:hypothetical protein
MIRAATHPMANDSKWKQEELFELVAAVKKANAKAFQDEITEDTLTRVVTGATLLQVFLGERRDLRKINVRVKFIQQALKKMLDQLNREDHTQCYVLSQTPLRLSAGMARVERKVMGKLRTIRAAIKDAFKDDPIWDDVADGKMNVYCLVSNTSSYVCQRFVTVVHV